VLAWLLAVGLAAEVRRGPASVLVVLAWLPESLPVPAVGLAEPGPWV
jgi:hypothetical protein